jgi:hypothetical protein
MLPTDLLILKPFLSNTKPWVITLEYGAFPVFLMENQKYITNNVSHKEFQMPKGWWEKAQVFSDNRVLMRNQTIKYNSISQKKHVIFA